MQYDQQVTEKSQEGTTEKPALSKTTPPSEIPIEIYTAYARADARYFVRIKEQLDILRRQGWPISSHESEITSAWQTSDHLATANLILLLVSTTFLNSDYCYSNEMHLAVERHRTDNFCYVIPIILHPVPLQLLKNTPFGMLNFLPTNRKPISAWRDSSRAFADIVGYLLDVLERMRFFNDVPRKTVFSSIESQEPKLHLSALASVALEKNDQALVDQDYIILAGIKKNETEEKKSPSNLSKDIFFDISLLTSDNIQLTSQWHGQLQYNFNNSNIQFISFTFQVKTPGKSSLTLNFYYKQLYLRTIKLTFNSFNKKLLTNAVEKE